MASSPTPKKHFTLGNEFHRAEEYKTKNGFPRQDVPLRDRHKHGGQLRAELSLIETAYSKIRQEEQIEDHIREKGLIIEIVTPHDFAAKTETLDRADRLQLLNHRPGIDAEGRQVVCQTWFVPDGSLSYLDEVLNEYLTTDTKWNKPQYQGLVDSIQSLKTAALAQLWTEPEPLPDAEECVWWEAWLRASGPVANREEIVSQFEIEAAHVGLKVGESRVLLPEHTIVAIRGSRAQLESSVALLNCLTELRKGRDFAGFFDSLPPDEQVNWSTEALPQLEAEPSLGIKTKDTRVALCVMDTGVNRGHPLIESRLPESRNLTIKQAWESYDHYGQTGHGTPMTGLSLYGNLTDVLGHKEAIPAPFVLEAVKIVPPATEENEEEKLAAAFTQMGTYLVESQGPFRKRIWCISTSLDEPDIKGVPGSWSSALDSLASGADAPTSGKRLFCLAGGNLSSQHSHNYSQGNLEHSCHTPAQAWNALVVGSCTFLDQIRSEKMSSPVLAKRGGMAPSNTTSCIWDNKWPNRPDIVFEGGNALAGSNGGSSLVAADLSLLSAAADFKASPFCGMTGTSPATALAARMAAQIQAAYPDYWPETVRGLMVHSAEWTPAMRQMAGKGSKTGLGALLRMVGYGYPRLSKALECAQSLATLVTQAELQPFKCDGPKSKAPEFNQLRMHSLPWPVQELRKYGETTVRMRVTLSYFIEPNPGNRGYGSNYGYASCGLRFKVSSPGQGYADLLANVDKETDMLLDGLCVKGSTNGWLLDQDMAHKGSVHSNIWQGSAADLADMSHIIIYPVTGWWKTRKALGRYDSKVRYSLIVSIETDSPHLDVYTEIAHKIEQKVTAGIQVDL